jgi:hypothetical protein
MMAPGTPVKRYFLSTILCVACGPSARGTTTIDADGASDASVGTMDAPNATTSVFAHTAKALFRIDPDNLSVTKVADFIWPNGAEEMTDLAINQAGDMIGISFGSVYRVDSQTARLTRLSNALTGGFNGLSFVPAALIGQTGADVLIGSRNSDGKLFRVDPNTGATSQVGTMGGNVTSSGDMVAVTGLGVYLTGDTGGTMDVLEKLSSPTLTASAIGTDIGFSNLWGLGFWKNKLFGFSSNGDFVTIDRTTGRGQLVMNVGQAWYGAAVATTAPVVQ